MRKTLVIAAAGAALAIGVPAAFAVGGSPSTTTTPVQSTQTPQPDQQRPNGDDCPEKGGGHEPDGGSAPPAPDSGTTTETPSL
jgi:hypothetical protein